MATPEDIRGHYVKVKGTRTFYDELGAGQAIVEAQDRALGGPVGQVDDRHPPVVRDPAPRQRRPHDVLTAPAPAGRETPG